MSNSTPTTQDVRHGYAEAAWIMADSTGEDPDKAYARAENRFNRWLAAHDRAVKAEAWDQGAAAAWERSTTAVNGERYHWRHEGEPANPYRAARIETGEEP